MKDASHTYVTLTITYQEQEEPEPVPEPDPGTNTQTNGNNDNEQGEPQEPTSTVYSIQNGYIKNVTEQTTLEAFLKNITLGGAGYVVRGQTVLKNTDIVATGDVLRTNEESYTIIVQADTSGDGSVNIMDLMQVKRHVLKSKLLTGNGLLAADLNADKKINIMDIMRVTKIIIK